MMGRSATQPPADEDLIDQEDLVRVLDDSGANLDDDGNELIEEAEIISSDDESRVIENDDEEIDQSKN